jgi:hypothetical protein
MDEEALAHSKYRPGHFTPKIKFTAEEDARLRELVARFGHWDWRLISRKLGTRNARQCRERWHNYLNPEISPPARWTAQEDAWLEAAVLAVGPHWATVQGFFPHRSKINIHNRFVVLQRRKRGRRPRSASALEIGETEATSPVDPQLWEPFLEKGQDMFFASADQGGDGDVYESICEDAESFNWFSYVA